MSLILPNIANMSANLAKMAVWQCGKVANIAAKLANIAANIAKMAVRQRGNVANIAKMAVWQRGNVANIAKLVTCFSRARPKRRLSPFHRS